MGWMGKKKEEKDPHEITRRQTILNRLADLTGGYWTSPKGKLCKITRDGLWIEETKTALPWGDVPTPDIELILRHNEREITKPQEILTDKDKIMEYVHQITALTKPGRVIKNFPEPPKTLPANFQLPQEGPQEAQESTRRDLDDPRYLPSHGKAIQPVKGGFVESLDPEWEEPGIPQPEPEIDDSELPF